MPNSPQNEPPPAPAPTLYAIIVLKLLKGFGCMILALIIYSHSDHDVRKDFSDLLEFLRLNPEGKFWANLLAHADGLTQAKIVHYAIATFIYSLFDIVEGAGLIFRATWAGWLSIGASAFFIPIEIYELGRRFNWWVFAILVLNAVIVSYLYANRERLFHHHPKPPASAPDNAA